MDNKYYVVISPYSANLSAWGNEPNPKNYPYWSSIVDYLTSKGVDIIQIGITPEPKISDKVTQFLKNLHFKEILELIKNSLFWMSVDNFLPHLVQHLTPPKKGIVIFGKSDPNIFGYSTNINILKSREYLRPDQFAYWFNEPFDPNVFPEPEKIFPFIDLFFK